MNPDPLARLFPPTGADLFRAFREALGECAELSCEFIGRPVEGPAVMSLERSLRLEGPARGLLVVRAHRKLGLMLMQKNLHGEGPWDSRDAAFDYLARLFAEKLVGAYWPLGEFKPLATRISNPQFWPPGPPAVDGALLVEMYPMEIRLWLDEKPLGVRQEGA
ncbi:MAG TPA: hypothetical protein VMU88_00410 [bacterium]|nr:hypothetical protein [bacterium]